jgi:hypothetical protein
MDDEMEDDTMDETLMDEEEEVHKDISRTVCGKNAV